MNMLFMEYTKHLQNASRKYDIIMIKYQKIHLGASILACFWALEPARGASWDGDPKKPQTITFGDPPFGAYL